MIKYFVLFLLIPKICFGFSPGMIGTGFTNRTITETLTPDGAGNYSNWVYTGAGNYTDVSTDDGATSYAEENDTSARFSVTVSDLASITTATKITVYGVMHNLNDGCSTRDYKLFYRMSSTDYDSANIAVSCTASTYATYSYEFTGSWTAAQINGMEIGVVHPAISSYGRVTYVYAVIEGE